MKKSSNRSTGSLWWRSFLSRTENERPDITGLAKHLRSDTPMTREDRDILANLIDPPPGGSMLYWRLSLIFKREKQKEARHIAEMGDLYESIHRRLDEGQSVTAAIPDAAVEVGMSASKAWILWREINLIEDAGHRGPWPGDAE